MDISYPPGWKEAARGAKRQESRSNNIHNSRKGNNNHNTSKRKWGSKQRRDQQRAATFRTRQETTKVIRLLDAYGSKRVIRQQGKMGLTKHVRVLTALELRALWYRNKEHTQIDQDQVLYDKALDETGIMDTANLADFDAESMGGHQQQQQWDQEASRREMEKMASISGKLLEVHGVAS